MFFFSFLDDDDNNDVNHDASPIPTQFLHFGSLTDTNVVIDARPGEDSELEVRCINSRLLIVEVKKAGQSHRYLQTIGLVPKSNNSRFLVLLLY